MGSAPAVNPRDEVLVGGPMQRDALHSTRLFSAALLVSLIVAGCRPDDGSGDPGFSDGASDSGTEGEEGQETEGESADEGTTGDEGGMGPVLDVGFDDETGGTGDYDECKVADDMDGVGDCMAKAPPDAFEPDLQWSWEGNGNDSVTTPLVANLTDDNDDGEIDLCDIPDVIVVATPYTMYALDGETGQEHWKAPVGVSHQTTPAIGDIDDDGMVEVVTLDQGHHLVAFEHDGTLKWTSPVAYTGFPSLVLTIGLADLDLDGDVEVFVRNRVFDHEGQMVMDAPMASNIDNWSASVAADLDDDDDMEIVMGSVAYHHDGTKYFDNPDVTQDPHGSYPTIADLDDDGLPEILITTDDGLTLLEHDGTTVYANLRPTGDPDADWNRPAAIHDFDGDGEAEYASSQLGHYTVFEVDASIVWSAEVDDVSGHAAGTAFDFLGAGKAQAMYADEDQLFVFDGDGLPLLSTPRNSVTQIEYPTVADVDNDGSAEIVVVSNFGGEPAVQVIRDKEDRWIQARRIWNQHTYHVTNVREDGTIPSPEPKHWELLNTFRTQAQIEGGGVCNPHPEG